LLQASVICGGYEVDWNVVSAISEALAAVAVVVSLLYLAKQFRVGSASAAAATHFEVTQALNNVFFDIAKDPELSRIYYKGNKNPETLSGEEIPRYMTMVGVIFSVFNNLYLQHEKGTLVEETWIITLKSIEGMAKSKGVQYWWKYNQQMYLVGLQEIVEQHFTTN
jgi:hypothetical protein